MRNHPKGLVEQDLSPDEMIASIEDQAAFMAEAVAEVVGRRAELDRRIKVARAARLSLRRIALAAGMSHTQIQRIEDQAGQALIEYALIISLFALVAIVALQTTGTSVPHIVNTIAGEV